MPKTIRPLPRRVALVGAGISKFGAFPEKSSRDLAVEAYQDLLLSVDKGLDPRAIEALYLGNYSSDLFERQGHTAPIIADALGLTPVPATRVEDACASGGVALRQGVLAIASGMVDVVLVGGVEKMTNLPTNEVTDVLATAADTLYEFPPGFSFPGLYAAMTSAYMAEYSMPPEHLMCVALKNHDNGALNPHAQFNMTVAQWMEGRKAAAAKKGKPVPTWKTEFEFLHDDAANPMVAWPLRLFDCSPITDGAAAVLLVGEERVSEFTDHPVWVTGSGQASAPPLHNRESLTSIPSARLAAQEAYGMAGVKPQDIRLAEVHDCFTIAEIIATEDLGFFPPGTGHLMAEQGATARAGIKPVNSSGGLKAKGHPVGASGVGQAVEIWKQMRGLAGPRQVPGDLSLGLTHNVGATGNTCAVHIFERGD